MIFVKLVNVVSLLSLVGLLSMYTGMIGCDVNTCPLFAVRRDDCIVVSFPLIYWGFLGGQRPVTLPEGFYDTFAGYIPSSSQTSQINMDMGLPILSCHQASGSGAGKT